MTSTGRITLLLLAALLGACTGNTEELLEMQDYVSSVVNRPPGRIEPLPEFISYEAFTYSAAGQRSPFSMPVDISSVVTDQAGDAIRPDENRRREPLEDFQLSNLRMVGTLSRRGRTRALIQDESNNIHQVEIGQYLGRNHGRVVDVSRTQVDIVEIVPNGAGGWLERPQVITLEE